MKMMYFSYSGLHGPVFCFKSIRFHDFCWIEHQDVFAKIEDFDENDVFFVFRVTRTCFL